MSAPKTSAGLLLFRRRNGEVEFLLAHPGGPWYAGKDAGYWGIPKGEIHGAEDPLAAAQREFEEETGQAPRGEFLALGTVRQESGKVVHAWAFEGDWDESAPLRSNHCEIEWPPHSGRKQSIPEIDQVAFCSLAEATRKINPAQQEFLHRLLAILAEKVAKSGESRSCP